VRLEDTNFMKDNHGDTEGTEMGAERPGELLPAASVLLRASVVPLP
jgi:hypothetical protein